jgi:maltose alpha-D-glucosyltransferase / alpha-amylase
MADRWFEEAVVYCLDVETFLDTNGDGIGDLRGVIARLGYLARLGVTTLWLNPVHASPRRDDGYDVTDFYSVHPQIGSLGDFVDLIDEAANHGIRVMIDLVVNHTSNEHPWFVSARGDPASQYRDWYVWSDERPADVRQGVVFPHHQATTWTHDRKAGAWYFHRFYDFEPDLNPANPDVRDEIMRIMGFWLQLGVAGFRMDAAPFVIEIVQADAAPTKDFELLHAMREYASWRRGDAVFLAEANVPRDELIEYFGSGDRLPMLFNFLLNQRLFLALAREEAAPLRQGVTETPTIPPSCQWATFLRNHDEIDLSGLTPDERAEVFDAFGPDPSMQLYDRGIRRRLAPMLGGDRRRIELAYSLQFTLPGTPVIRYGEEIGMGDDLSLPERNAIRTPMQWDASENGGFSTAPRRALVRPVIADGEYGYPRVNVADQRRDSKSLLGWIERAVRVLRECPEFGTGEPRVVDVRGHPSVFAVAYDAPSGAMLALHNLSGRGVTVDLGPQAEQQGQAPAEVFSTVGHRDQVDDTLDRVRLAPYGYRWIRLRSSPGPGLHT